MVPPEERARSRRQAELRSEAKDAELEVAQQKEAFIREMEEKTRKERRSSTKTYLAPTTLVRGGAARPCARRAVC
jgi:hypothetical protein